MTNYGIEINVVIDSKGTKEWKRLRPTNGQPYVFESFQEAVKTAEMCYPDNQDDVKIVKV